MPRRRVGQETMFEVPEKRSSMRSTTEVLLLSPLDGRAPTLDKLVANWSIETADGGYLVPRQDSHFWFMITVRQAPSMFAKVRGVDLRLKSFPNLAIAQTSIAWSNAIVIRDDRNEMPAYHLLGASASAGCMWECILDAMAEGKGRPVGLNALSALG